MPFHRNSDLISALSKENRVHFTFGATRAWSLVHVVVLSTVGGQRVIQTSEVFNVAIVQSGGESSKVAQN